MDNNLIKLTMSDKDGSKKDSVKSSGNSSESGTSQDTIEVSHKLNIGSLPTFDTKGDPNTLWTQWKRWKRAFDIYLRASGVKNPDQKVAMLLHTGGLDLQDLYYTLVPETTEGVTYEECVNSLDEYFTPQTNVPFERHLFRQMEQMPSETVDQFVCRLRQKVAVCNFHDVDEAIRDQLIDKCKNKSIQRKFLEQPSGATLQHLQNIARAYEAVDSQMMSMERADNMDAQVNAVSAKSSSDKAKAAHNDSDSGKRCHRCNKVGHFARDKQCPAHGEECYRCRKIGHFAKCCKTKFQNKQQYKPYTGRQRNQTYQIEDMSADGEDYAFAVDTDECDSDSGIIDLEVGGVAIQMTIDSGATFNLIDRTTWELLKAKHVKCHSQKAKKYVYAYGRTPIEVLGKFEATTECNINGEKCIAEFTVVNKRDKSLLGRRTAEKLDLLRVGPRSVDSNMSSNVRAVVEEDNDIKTNYPDVFQGVGKLKDFELKLHVKETVEPVAQHVRRLPFGLRKKVEEKLQELLDNEIIEEVPSRPTGWASPLVAVLKPSGDVRICVDMRRANQAIERERHPIPTVEEVLLSLNQSSVYSKLDLKWGFHQIQLAEESREITTFVTHLGLFRYRRLMFGIASAPEKYQQIIRDILRGCNGVANIADDIIVHGRDLKEHDQNLFKVLDRLRECGLTLNGDKCQFRISKLTFFGHDLGVNGISPTEEKIAAVRNAQAPKKASEVRSFLGLVQYSSKFLPSYSQVAEPLRMLTRKNQPFVWGQAQENSFQKLKELITRAETLAYFREDCRTRVIADAGPAALGAVLTQLQNNTWRVIAYASRNLSDVERRYCQTEKEALALVWACERFNLYIFGRRFELETDHKPLECIYGKTSKTSARIERWVLRLQSYDYKVIYRPGKTNIADTLSRLNQSNPKDLSGEKVDFVRAVALECTPVAMTAKEVERASENDPELSAVRTYIHSGDWSKCKLPQYLCVKDELCTLGKLVLRGTRIVVPQSLRPEVLRLAHEGHQGIVKMKARLRTKVWWPKVDFDAERICKTCHGCQVVGEFSVPEPMDRVKPPSGPWQDIAVDLMGPLPTGESLLVAVDYFSRYYEVVIMHSTTSSRIINALTPIFSRYGYPFSLKSDNGSQFVSAEFETFLESHGVEHRKSPPLWPQANGEVERQNRTLLKALKIAHVEGKPWQTELHKFLLAYRSTPHTSTGETPAFLMLRRELRTKLPELREENSIFDEHTRDRDWSQKLAGKAVADTKRRAATCTIAPGDLVLLKNTKGDGKLATNFEPEPYVVQAKEGKEVTLRSQLGTQYQRDSSFVKPYEQAKFSQQDVQPDVNLDHNVENDYEQFNNGPAVDAYRAPNSPPLKERLRPRHQIKAPERYS